VQWAYAVLDWGPEEFSLSRERLAYGANMAFRSAEQRANLFDPNLGYRQHRKIAGEETAVMKALLTAGGEGRWVPGARVQHLIPAERQNVGFLRACHFGRGVQNCYELSAEFGSAPHWFGRPRWLWRQWLQSEVSYRVRRLFCRPEAWIPALVSASTAHGSLHGYSLPPGRSTDTDAVCRST
jgi:hypothetical protein